MSDTEKDRLELLERQLAERVGSRVQASLFKLYAAAGLAVISVVGFFGWDLVGDIKSEIKTEVTQSIEADIGRKRLEISERVTEARFMANRANEVIQRVETQLDEFEPQAKNLNDTISKVRDLNITSRDLIANYSNELKPLVANVESLSSQLRVLAEQVDELSRISSGNEIPNDPVAVQTYEQRSNILSSVISDNKAAEERYAQARSKPTIFLQYTDGSQTQAEDIAAELKGLGYWLPGEERVDQASGKREVRYFHEEDEQAAQKLADDVNSVLTGMGLLSETSMEVGIKSLVSYRSKKPGAGILELWLDIGQLN
jgi:archaellum component FlaC